MNACNLGFSYDILYSSGPLYISIFLILPFIAYIAGLIYADWLQSTAAAILGSYLIFFTSLIGSLPAEPLPTFLLLSHYALSISHSIMGLSTANADVSLLMLSPGLSLCHVSAAVHDPFILSKPEPLEKFLHISKFDCQLESKPQHPMDSIFFVLTLSKCSPRRFHHHDTAFPLFTNDFPASAHKCQLSQENKCFTSVVLDFC